MDRGGGTCYMLTYFWDGGGVMRRGEIFSGGVEIFLE